MTRFGEVCGGCRYSKAEAWTSAVQPTDFDWLVTGADGPLLYNTTHVPFDRIMGFAGLRLDTAALGRVLRGQLRAAKEVVEVAVEPQIYLMRRLAQTDINILEQAQ